jgi:hypothetical protein
MRRLMATLFELVRAAVGRLPVITEDVWQNHERGL